MKWGTFDGDPEAQRRFALAQAAHDAGDFIHLETLARELIDYCASVQYVRGIAYGYNLLGNAHLYVGDLEHAQTNYQLGREQFASIGDRLGEAIVLQNLGSLALSIDVDLLEARRLYEEAVTVFEQAGNARGKGIALGNLSEVSRLDADYDGGLRYAKEALELFQTLDDKTRIGWQLVNIAFYSLMRRKYKQAIEELRHAYAMLAIERNPWFVASYLDTCFVLAAELHQKLRAFLDLRTNTAKSTKCRAWPSACRCTHRNTRS